MPGLRGCRISFASIHSIPRGEWSCPPQAKAQSIGFRVAEFLRSMVPHLVGHTSKRSGVSSLSQMRRFLLATRFGDLGGWSLGSCHCLVGINSNPRRTEFSSSCPVRTGTNSREADQTKSPNTSDPGIHCTSPAGAGAPQHGYSRAAPNGELSTSANCLVLENVMCQMVEVISSFYLQFFKRVAPVANKRINPTPRALGRFAVYAGCARVIRNNVRPRVA